MSEYTPSKAANGPGLNGWVEAGLFVVAISALTIVYALADVWGANVLVFVLYASAVSSLGMLAMTGLGRDPLSVITTRQSWFYGVAAIAMEAAFFQLLATVSPAEASLTVRLTVPASLFLGWLVFARPISHQTLWGAAIVIAAVLPVFWFLAPAVRPAAFALATACALIAAIKTFASEFHPQNRAAKTVMDKIRVTGLVVLATTVVGTSLLLPLSALAHAGAVDTFGMIPPPSAFWHGPTLLSAIVLGAPILVAMNYLTFSSAVKITTENFLATSAFTPLGALIAQSLAAKFGLIAVPPFDPWLIVLIAIGIVGVMIIIRARRDVI